VRNPCYYGIDMPTREELIAATKSTETRSALLGVDSLGYLSLEGMLEAVGGRSDTFCHACFSGDYWTLAAGWWGDFTDDEAVAMLHRAHDLGITLFDSSDTYGNGRADELLGRAFRRPPRRGGDHDQGRVTTSTTTPTRAAASRRSRTTTRRSTSARRSRSR
jgi:aryl-alcohol dehydrogenase-like predicted oxidoreductase